MTSSVPTPAFDDLLRHEHFVRKTLRGLLRCDASIDDAVQETWLRALQQPPAERAEPQRWLARIARNLAVSGWRSQQRRQRREMAIGDAVAESAEASQRRVEMRQRVVAAILALDEPYRSVVLLRYEQDLDFAAIAQRLGRSPATVRSQLSRAHELLRQRLDRDFGGRERWGVLAAPLVPTSGTGTPAVSGLVLTSIAALLAVAIGWIGWRSFGATTPPANVAVAVAATSAAEPTTPANVPRPTPTPLQRDVLAPQEPRPQGLQERLLPPAVLRDRTYYDDYEAATFSFEHGVRDDPDLEITRNDWDVLFDHGTFRVDTVVDDHSVIVDLGAMDPHLFGAFRAPSLQFATELELEIQSEHAYFIGTRDGDTDLATVVFVRSLEPGDSCSFDWYTTDGSGRAQGSLADPGKGRAWIEILAELRAQRLRGRMLAQPIARLQLRGGAGGGNPRRIDLAGDANGYVDERRLEPFDVVSPATMNEKGLAFADGGMVPARHAFVVTRIEYAGGNRGDTNGQGGFRIVLDGEAIVDIEPSADPIAGTWSGRVSLAPGSESRTFFEIANSSWGEVRLMGEFVPDTRSRGFGGTNRGFFAATPPKPVTKPWALGVPQARLQVRAASVGGNPCRIDLRGRKSLYVERLAKAPLDLTMPLAPNERSVAYGRGGMILEGTVFVVSKVTWSGIATGDSNGNGAFRVVVAGQKLIAIESSPEPIAGEWTGRLEVVPGEESRTYLEVANASHGDVVLMGHFEKQ